MGTIEKRGRNSWRVGVQVLTDTGWQWIRETIKMPPGMTEARQRKEAEKALAQLTADANAGRVKARIPSAASRPCGWSSTSGQTASPPPARIINSSLIHVYCR